MGCTSLLEVEIPDGATYIGKSAFDGCSSLERLTIGKCIRTISAYAFSGCTALREIYYKAIAINQCELSYSVFGSAGSLFEGITVRIASGVEKMPRCLLSEYTYYTSHSPSVPNISSVEFDDEEVEDIFRKNVVARLSGLLGAISHSALTTLTGTIDAIGK